MIHCIYFCKTSCSSVSTQQRTSNKTFLCRFEGLVQGGIYLYSYIIEKKSRIWWKKCVGLVVGEWDLDRECPSPLKIFWRFSSPFLDEGADGPTAVSRKLKRGGPIAVIPVKSWGVYGFLRCCHRIKFADTPVIPRPRRFTEVHGV